MFDIGFWEFVVIGIITLIIVGPEKMPEIARKAGVYAGKIKRFVGKIQDDISNELDSNTIKQHLRLEDEEADIVEIIKDSKNSIKDIKK